MFGFKVAAVLAAVATVADVVVVAVPTQGSDSCGQQKLQCCDSLSSNDTSSDSKLLGLIPINIQDLGVPIGLNCVPLSLIGLGSSGNCNAQAACCSNVDNSGLVPIGLECTPINLSL
ncbi:hypothetical protein ACEPAI_1735 [Sanghuangporus weigelae]